MKFKTDPGFLERLFVILVVVVCKSLQNTFLIQFIVKDLNDIDPDDMDDALGSDIDGSETDSKMSDSKRDGKSQGNSSKPRR